MLSFRGVCCHGHSAPWLWWEKEEVNLRMMLSVLLHEVKRSKDALLDEGNKRRVTSGKAELAFFLLLLSVASSKSIKKFSFVTARRMALADRLVCDTIWPSLFLKSHRSPLRTLCCDLLVYKCATKNTVFRRWGHQQVVEHVQCHVRSFALPNQRRDL